MNEFKFDPWIGKNYENGFNGKKVLILGESHYKNSDTKFTFPLNDFTKACIGAQIGEPFKNGVWTHAFFTKTLNAMKGISNPTQNNKKEFWQSVIFYNYVQDLIEGNRKAPNKTQWKNSISPFLFLIGKYKPELVVVLGYRLWDELKNSFDLVEKIEIEYVPNEKRPHIFQLKPSIASEIHGTVEEIKPFVALPFKHPSSVGFSPKKWNKKIVQTLDKLNAVDI